MKPTYNITLVRLEDGNEVAELESRDITADQAIDLLIHLRELDTLSSETAPEESEQEEEVEEEPEPVPDPNDEPAAEKTGGKRPTYDYDLDAVLTDLRDGIKPKAVAEKHDIPVQTVYNIKHRFKDEIEPESYEASDEAPVTEYAEKKRGFFLKSKTEPSEEERMSAMAKEGCSVAELQMMFPSMPLETIQSEWDYHNA